MPPHTAVIHLAPYMWTILLLTVAAAAAFKTWGFLRERELRQLSYLRSSCLRLRAVVAEMLAKVNELDQSIAYSAADVAADRKALSAKLIGTTCEDLVNLSESLPLLEELIDGKNRRLAREHLLRSCRMAEKISAELAQMRMLEFGSHMRDSRRQDNK